MENKYFVYIHLFESKPIYVGCGSLYRVNCIKKQRSKEYLEFVKQKFIEIFIYRAFEDRKLAIKCEEIITEAIGLENLFNMRVGNKSIFSQEHREKLSKSGKGRFFSEETRRKLSESAKLRKLPIEVRIKISEAQKGKNKIRTQKLSEETKLKMSIAKQNMSKETKEKLSIATKKHWEYKKMQNGK